MNRLKLSDEEWERLLAELRKIPGIRIGVPMKCRFFVEAVLWILRTGAQWRVLPVQNGRWNSVFKRFSRWSKLGVWVGYRMSWRKGVRFKLMWGNHHAACLKSAAQYSFHCWLARLRRKDSM
ncbi:MAG: transposase [Sulfuricella sp.]